MIRLLIQNWWLLLVRGMFAVLFAIFIFVFLPFVPAPLLRQLAFAGVSVVFAGLAICTGAITIAAAIRTRSRLLMADGILVSFGGLVVLLSPGLTLTHVIQVIALVALLVGFVEILAGVHLRRHVQDEWLLVLSGLISVAFAVCLLLTPSEDRHTVLVWIALYAASGGLAMVGLAFRLRSLRQAVHVLAASSAAAKA
jgi:uncharacterized membrane protein HdeD (DUF308 family)